MDVEPFNAVDLNAEYRGLENWMIDLSVINTFNRQPPYDSGSLIFLPPNPPYDSSTYDDMGRIIGLRVTYKF